MPICDAEERCFDHSTQQASWIEQRAQIVSTEGVG
jgi:hypothetical protein